MQDRWHGTDGDIRQKTWKQISWSNKKRWRRKEERVIWDVKSSLWNVAQPHLLPNVKNSSQFVWTTLQKENTPRILPHLSCFPGPSRLPSSTAAWLHFSSKGGIPTWQRGRVTGKLSASLSKSESSWWSDSVSSCHMELVQMWQLGMAETSTFLNYSCRAF